MRITIDTTDDTIAGVIESLKLIADSELHPDWMGEQGTWLKHVSISGVAGPVELNIFRFNNLED